MSAIVAQIITNVANFLSSTRVLVSLAFGFILWKCYRSFLNWIVLRRIPSPNALPILGHHLQLRKFVDDLPVIEKWTRECGSVFRVRPMGWLLKEQIFISDPEAIKRILVTNSHNYFKSDFIKKIVPNLGNGLLTSNGKAHAMQRKRLAPLFNYNNLKTMFPKFRDKAQFIVKIWARKNELADGGERKEQIQRAFSRLTLDVIGQCAFGYEFNTMEDGKDEISLAFVKMLQNFNISDNFLKFIPVLKHIPTASKREEETASKVIDNVIVQVIKKKRKTDTDEAVPKDLLQLLLDASVAEQEQTSDEELRAQVFTFLLAGNETTSVAMAWTLYYLALYPEIQQQARDEISNVADDDTISLAQVNSMKLLTAVIHETLRLRPPVPIVARYAVKDDVLCGYKIPAGTPILISPYVLHRCPKYWKEPNEFDPHRFLSAENPPLHAFLPFLHGPRMCLGYKFAMMEMKTILALLLRHFSFSLPSDSVFQPAVQFTYRLTPPLELIVTKL